MLHKSRSAMYIAALMVSSAAISVTQADEVFATAIKGKWQSESLESTGPFFATRAFEITDREWSVVYRTYADSAGRTPLFTLNVAGNYLVEGKSPMVPDAYEGIFPALKRQLTAESEAGVELFAKMGCKMQKGRAKLLVNTGCGFVPGVMQTMGEYDLVAIVDGKLFFGDRTGDLTRSRPEKLTPFPLRKTD